MTQESRKRRYTFTINNPKITPKEFGEQHIVDYQVKYMIVSYEIGESGTPHLQGYVEYINGATFKQVIARFQEWKENENGEIEIYQFGHIEVAIANGQANKKYIIKQQPNELGIDMFEYGEMSIKVSIDEMASDIVELITDNKKSLVTVIKEYPEYANYIVKNWQSLVKIQQSTLENFGLQKELRERGIY